MTSGFLTKDNFHHIFGIVKSYLIESFKLDVSDNDLSATVAQTMKTISAEKKPDDTIDALNKKVIVTVRDVYTKKKSQPPPAIVAKQASMYEQRTQDVPNDEDMFMQKLRDVEIQRTTTDVVGAQPALGGAEEQVVSGSVVQNTAPSTIIVQNTAPTKTRTQVHVARSYDRLWMYQCNRNGFIYSGIETRTAKEIMVTQVVLPASAHLSYNGYFTLQIESAGHDIENIHLIPRTTNNKWVYLETLTGTGMELARTLSTPWILTICDSFGQSIELGADGWSIINAIVTQRGSTVCTLSNAMTQDGDVMHHFSDGDVVQVHVTDAAAITTTILYTTSSYIELAGINIPSNGVIINLSRQVSVFFAVVEKK
jgi:hypothetical protein